MTEDRVKLLNLWWSEYLKEVIGAGPLLIERTNYIQMIFSEFPAVRTIGKIQQTLQGRRAAQFAIEKSIFNIVPLPKSWTDFLDTFVSIRGKLHAFDSGDPKSRRYIRALLEERTSHLLCSLFIPYGEGYLNYKPGEVRILKKEFCAGLLNAIKPLCWPEALTREQAIVLRKKYFEIETRQANIDPAAHLRVESSAALVTDFFNSLKASGLIFASDTSDFFSVKDAALTADLVKYRGAPSPFTRVPMVYTPQGYKYLGKLLPPIGGYLSAIAKRPLLIVRPDSDVVVLNEVIADGEFLEKINYIQESGWYMLNNFLSYLMDGTKEEVLKFFKLMTIFSDLPDKDSLLEELETYDLTTTLYWDSLKENKKTPIRAAAVDNKRVTFMKSRQNISRVLPHFSFLKYYYNFYNIMGAQAAFSPTLMDYRGRLYSPGSINGVHSTFYRKLMFFPGSKDTNSELASEDYKFWLSFQWKKTKSKKEALDFLTSEKPKELTPRAPESIIFAELFHHPRFGGVSVGFDATASMMQILGCLLFDKILLEYTNLFPLKRDYIYDIYADLFQTKFHNVDHDKICATLLKSRPFVKYVVMVTVYGGTVDGISKALLREPEYNYLDKEVLYKAIRAVVGVLNEVCPLFKELSWMTQLLGEFLYSLDRGVIIKVDSKVAHYCHRGVSHRNVLLPGGLKKVSLLRSIKNPARGARSLLANLIHFIDSYVIVELRYRLLKLHNVPCITIHDCIVVSPSNVRTVIRVYNDILREVMFDPKFDILTILDIKGVPQKELLAFFTDKSKIGAQRFTRWERIVQKLNDISQEKILLKKRNDSTYKTLFTSEYPLIPE